jgi:hypothetical protein
MNKIIYHFKGETYWTYSAVAIELGIKHGQEILTVRFAKLLVKTHNTFVRKMKAQQARQYNESDFVPNNQ